MIRRPTRLLRPAAVWLSLAVLLATLALAQPFRRVGAGFYHRHYDPPTRTLRTIHLTAHDGQGATSFARVLAGRRHRATTPAPKPRAQLRER